MRNLKMFLTAAVFTVMSIITGCSDQITSSGQPYVKSSNKGRAPEVSNQIDRPKFRAQIRLKPNKSYTFNYSNTGLISFNSIDADRIYDVSGGIVPEQCKDIQVSSDQILKYDLGCHSRGLDLKEITVKNTGSSMFDLDVFLTGKKRVKTVAEVE